MKDFGICSQVTSFCKCLVRKGTMILCLLGCNYSNISWLFFMMLHVSEIILIKEKAKQLSISTSY